jgi:hypothetical protein
MTGIPPIKIKDSKLSSLYKTHPDFDVTSFNFLDDKAVSSLQLKETSKAATLQKLKAYQRLLKIHPDETVAETLFKGGMQSARQITSLSQSSFVRKFEKTLNGGANTAISVHKNANAIKTQVMHLWANVNHLKNSPHFMELAAAPAPGVVTEPFENLSSYQHLFGSLNYCDCPECKSILGPAAYLTDLLRLIDKAITKSNTEIPNGLSFDERRPDIANIKLTCANTNNLVPYLQIVNEILEETLENKLPASDLYFDLVTRLYPFNLPFNLPLAQIRTYLDQNGTSLSQIFKVMQKQEGLSVPAAREYLGISIEELHNYKKPAAGDLETVLSENYGLTIIAGNLAGLNAVDFFLSVVGISLDDLRSLLYENLNTEEIVNVSGDYSITNLTGTTISFTQSGDSVRGESSANNWNMSVEGILIGNTFQGTWEQNAASVITTGYCQFVFANDCSGYTGNWNTGMGLPWQTTTWNGTRTASSAPAPGGIIPHNFFINTPFTSQDKYLHLDLNTSDSKIQFEEIVNLDINTLDTLNRFIRITQKLNWSYQDLDWTLLTISTLATPVSREISDATFVELAKIQKLHTEYGLPLDLLTTLWYDIKTTGVGSGQFSAAPFDQIFNGPEQVGFSDTHAYHPKYDKGYQRFVNPLYQSDVIEWSLKDSNLLNLNPAGNIIVSGIPTTTDSIRQIAVAAFGDVDVIKLTVENLSVLYRHTMFVKVLNIQTDEYTTLLKLLGITQTANTAYISATLIPDQAIKIVETLKWVRSAGTNAFGIDYMCNGKTSTYINPGYDEKNVPVFLKAFIPSIQKVFLLPGSYSGNGISAEMSQTLYTWLSTSPQNFVDANGLVLNKKVLTEADLAAFTAFPLTDSQKKNIVQTTDSFRKNQTDAFSSSLASFFQVKGDLMACIIAQVAQLLETPDYLAYFITAPGSPNDTFVYAFIRSASRFILFYKTLGLNNNQITGVITNPAAYNQAYTVDLASFAITFPIANVYALYSFMQLEAKFGDKKNQLVIYFASVGTSGYDACAELSLIAGWHEDQCANLCDYFFGTGVMCTTVEHVSILNRAFTITARLGIDSYFLRQLNEISTWTDTDPANWKKYNDYSMSLLQNVKAIASPEAWPNIFKNMNSNLEEEKRNAMLNLAVWLVGKKYPDITTADNLYEFLLVDVKRAGCQDISYIKEALNAAQLYLQRCRLNLERNVVIDKADLPDVYWEWIMNYRVWEANREVFLYPENYIDPSLRETKTDLFKELENNLSQGNITQKTVEDAYRKYLDSFQELATLQYVDGYHCVTKTEQDGETDTLFLFARTQNKPYTYFYISRQGDNTWSQWSEINIHVNADYITPVYAFSKLFVFWVEVTDIQEKENDSDALNSTVTMATIKYSFYNFNGDWCQPQTLLADHVLNIEDRNPGKNFHGPFNPDIFDREWLYWNKVALISVNKSNYTESAGGSNETEKIVVYYGPLLNKNLPSGNNPATSGGPDFRDFVDTIDRANLTLSEMKNANQSGFFPLNPSIILNTNLDDSCLIDGNEFLILEDNKSDAQNAYPSFNASLEQLKSKLILNPENNSLAGNYREGMGLKNFPIILPNTSAVAGSFINPALNIDSNLSTSIFGILQSPAVEIIDSKGKVQSSIVTTSTQVLRTLCQNITLDQAKYVRDTLFDLFYGSAYIFAQIPPGNTSVIPIKNQPGWFILQTAYETFLFEAYNNKSSDKRTFSKISERTIITAPFGYVTYTDFITPDIPRDVAITITGLLESPAINLVDTNGIVNLALLKTMSVKTLTGLLQLASDVQGQEIYFILEQSAKAALQYSSNGFSIDDNIQTLSISTTRISTAVIQTLSHKLFTSGIDGLLALSSQQAPTDVNLPFDAYQPGRQVIPPAVSSGDQVDFSGPFGNYFWELFFHGPSLVAKVLNTNQQFQASENWLQYIFNPTLKPDVVSSNSFITESIDSQEAAVIYDLLSSPALGLVDQYGAVTPTITQMTPAQLTSLLQNVTVYQGQEVYNILKNNYLSNALFRYWQFNPFRTYEQESLVKLLTNPAEIHAYNVHPFDPHSIARLRIGAYGKTIVMQYVSNLINWGDYEYRLYTWESITSALMLYTYAFDLLGPRPVDYGPCESEYPVSFSEILERYSNTAEGIPQFLIDMENVISSSLPRPVVPSGNDVPFNDIEAYFCVPENDLFISNWDTIENRMYNIRHCLNINGVAQPLPLFDPPINPMDLVNAAASGNNILNAASIAQPNIPAYRFTSIVRRAKDLTSIVMQLGSNLLAALEKNDAEGMALLQSGNEITILNLSTLIKEQQITDAQNQLLALQQSLDAANYRQTYYQDLSSNGLNANEIADLVLRAEAIVAQVIAAGINGVSIAAYLAPNIFGLADGGMQFGEAVSAGANISSIGAEILNQSAGIVSTAGSYQRRQEDWDFQKNVSGYDIQQITNQISSSQARIAIAQQELIVQQKSIEQAQDIDSYLKGKFTNQDMYQWMISRISSLYFQTYNMALDLALQAQAAYQFEMDSSAQMISFAYWDNLYKGLLSGESLMMSIQQMENSYYQNNTRVFEIEKTISLFQQFPEEFLKFKWGHNGGVQGKLDFILSEKLFDLDFPGQYCRKIKSVSISIPAVIGPYQNLNATLTQNSNMTILMSDNLDAVKYTISKTTAGTGLNPPEPDSSVLRQNWNSNQAIAISKGMNDSGLFVLDFNDERYLPFEGTGAVSNWSLSLPPDTNRINFDSISDVIITVKYTAKNGGTAYAGNVKSIYKILPDSSGDFVKAKTFDLRQAFSSGWFKLFNTPPDGNDLQSISFQILDNFWLPGLTGVTIEKLLVQIEALDKASLDGNNFLQLLSGTKSVYFDVSDNFAVLNASDLQTIGFGTGTKDCTLQFNVANTPSLLTKGSGSDTRLDETKFLNMEVVILYTETAF